MNTQTIYKVFIPLYKRGKLMGTSVLIEEFDTLASAKVNARSHMFDEGSEVETLPYIREYVLQPGATVIIGGDHAIADDSRPYEWKTQDSGSLVCYLHQETRKWKMVSSDPQK